MSKKWIIILLITVLLPGIVMVLCSNVTAGTTTSVGFIQQLAGKGYKVTDITDKYVKTQAADYETAIYEIDLGTTKIGSIEVIECRNKETADAQKQKIVEVMNSPLIDWAAKPHLYYKDKLLVEYVGYVGDNAKLKNDIKAILGNSLEN